MAQKLFLQFSTERVPVPVECQTPGVGHTDHVTRVPVGNGNYVLLTSKAGFERLIAQNEVQPDALVVSFVPAIVPPGVQQLSLVFSDSQESYDQMKDAIHEHVPRIAKEALTGRKIIVHCHAGASRSVTFVIAILMNAQKLRGEEVITFSDANQFIRDLRIDPNNPECHLNMTSVNLAFCQLLTFYHQELTRE